MAPTGWSSTARNVSGRAVWLLACAVAALVCSRLPAGRYGEVAWAQDLVVSAKVDHTTVDLGQPITLTLTLSGDVSGVRLPPLEFPEGFAIAGSSRATTFSIRSGIQERSMNFVYVLVPRDAGTFKLGPFTFRHGRQEFQTEPIEITVNKPALPPKLQPQGERFTL